MDEAERYLREGRVPPAVREWVRSVEGSDTPTRPVPFRPSRLHRYEGLYERVALQLLKDGFFVLATNGGPMALWVELCKDGTGVFGYLYFTIAGRSRLDPCRELPEAIAWRIEMALLNSRVRPLAHQPALADDSTDP
jgi:hypothetical protein